MKKTTCFLISEDIVNGENNFKALIQGGICNARGNVDQRREGGIFGGFIGNGIHDSKAISE